MSVDDPEEFLRTVKMLESATISLELEYIIENSGDQTFIHLDEVFSEAMKYIFRIQANPPENIDYMEKFSPELFDNLERCIDKILKECVKEAFANEPHPDIDLEEHEDIDKCAEAIISEILYYEGLMNDLEELSEIIEEIDDVRKRSLQISYS